jgi:hypothetical protein
MSAFLLDALVTQINQRFQHEKRVRVCLWFDEKRDFDRLLPSLQAHLDTLAAPAFELLVYDESKHRGQLWLKHQMYRHLRDAGPEARKHLRFLVYLPFPEEAVDAPETTSGPALDLLAEYRIAGLTWRIGGKRPTLFSFLKQAGVSLPASSTDQRRLYEGGRDSLLAKYVARFALRPAVFWDTRLTPELAQARLVGDIDQAVFELAAEPEAVWKGMRDAGTDEEFLDLVREKYGFSHAMSTPSAWMEQFATTLALTETWLGYGEPSDFPFAERIAPLALRPHHRDLLARWLRDVEYRQVWDQWAEAVEAKVSLVAWARGRRGRCFSLPSLTFERLRQMTEAFDEASRKDSTTQAFFQEHAEALAHEAEFARASSQDPGAWALLRDAGEFLRECTAGGHDAATADSAAAVVKVYIRRAASIDGQHVHLRYRSEDLGIPGVALLADRSYGTYTNALNARFVEYALSKGDLNGTGLQDATARIECRYWNAKGRRALVIVDALRFDCGLAIRDRLGGLNVEVEGMLATVPTITPFGMTALLPLAGAERTVEIKGNSPMPRVNGINMSSRQNRLAFLQSWGADCRDIADVEGVSAAPADLGEVLVVFGHEDVDTIGHGQADALIRHLHIEIERLARLVRKLHAWGYEQVHVVTDHGFVLLDEAKLPPTVACDKAWCEVLKERFALVKASVDVDLLRLPFAWDPGLMVAVPPGLAFFKAEKSFSHGGAALQELVIPHLVSRGRAVSKKRVGVEVLVPVNELQRAVVKVTLRPTSQDSGPQGALFAASGRTLLIDVLRPGRESVLPDGKPVSVLIEPSTGEVSKTLFFHSAIHLTKGELLDLDVRDAETQEQFGAGIKLVVGRDM